MTLLLGASGAREAPPHLDAALAAQRNLAQQRPGDAGVWNDLGNLLVMRGADDEAEGAYLRALEIDPTSRNARFNLALLRQQRGDLSGAAADYRALLDLDAGNAWAHYQLGSVYDAQGQRQLALARYAEAFTLDPELLFPEKNPHIIDNHLVTEALLMARRGSRSGPPAPRAYDEADRITSLLAPASPAATGAATVAEPAREDDAAGSGPPHAPGRVHADDPSEAEEQDRQGDDDAAAAFTVEPRDRVLSSSDLRNHGVRNQVQGEADGGAVTHGGRGRTGATVRPAPGRSSLHQPPVDDENAFGFGQRSTGSLEWRLGPVSDQPVPAR
jgi:tetratricopeptide (TPR) repeat protein